MLRRASRTKRELRAASDQSGDVLSRRTGWGPPPEQRPDRCSQGCRWPARRCAPGGEKRERCNSDADPDTDADGPLRPQSSPKATKTESARAIRGCASRGEILAAASPCASGSADRPLRRGSCLASGTSQGKKLFCECAQCGKGHRAPPGHGSATCVKRLQIELGIDQCGRDRLVAEHIGDSLEGGSTVDHPCRQRVPQRVWAAITDAGALKQVDHAVPDVDLDIAVQGAGTTGGALRVGSKRRLGRTADCEDRPRELRRHPAQEAACAPEGSWHCESSRCRSSSRCRRAKCRPLLPCAVPGAGREQKRTITQSPSGGLPSLAVQSALHLILR